MGEVADDGAQKRKLDHPASRSQHQIHRHDPATKQKAPPQNEALSGSPRDQTMSGYSMGTAEAIDQLNESAERIEKQLEGMGGNLDRIARGAATARLEGELVRIGDALESIGDGLANLATEHGATGAGCVKCARGIPHAFHDNGTDADATPWVKGGPLGGPIHEDENEDNDENKSHNEVPNPHSYQTTTQLKAEQTA